jgi:hypothetical protein
MMLRTVALIPVAIAAALALAACTEGATPRPTPTAPAPSAPADPTGDPDAERTFALPADCTTLLPAARQQTFADQGMTLLGGPGGTYPDYYADPTPEEQAGGISCIWGDEDTPSTIVTVSVAPLTASTRGQVVDDLLAQGLNEAVLDDGVSYAQLGDETSAPAVLNVIRDDSWISVIEALGGEAFFNEAVELATEAANQVYRP